MSAWSAETTSVAMRMPHATDHASIARPAPARMPTGPDVARTASLRVVRCRGEPQVRDGAPGQYGASRLSRPISGVPGYLCRCVASSTTHRHRRRHVRRSERRVDDFDRRGGARYANGSSSRRRTPSWAGSCMTSWRTGRPRSRRSRRLRRRTRVCDVLARDAEARRLARPADPRANATRIDGDVLSTSPLKSATARHHARLRCRAVSRT